MTIDHWLRIAEIISVLLAPVLATKMLLRANRQPTIKPETNQPKQTTQVIKEWFTNTPAWFWFGYAFLIVISTFALVRAVRSQAPIDRAAVANIVLAELAIAFQFVILFLTLLLDAFLATLREITIRPIEHTVEDIRQLNERTGEWMKRVTEALEMLSPKPSRFEQLIENIKNKLLP